MTEGKWPTGSISEIHPTNGQIYLTMGEIRALGITSGLPVRRTPELVARLANTKQAQETTIEAGTLFSGGNRFWVK